MGLFELLILIFILAPLVEALLKKRQGSGEPPPLPPDGPNRRPDHSGRPRAGAGRAPARDGPGPASDMIPEELWQVLTGERRPGPADVEWEGEWEQAADEVGREAEEAEEWTTAHDRPAGQWESYKGAEPEPVPGDAHSVTRDEIDDSDTHAFPEARSLETFPSRPRARSMPAEGLAEEHDARHRRFHRKLDSLAPPVTGYRQGRLRLGLGDPDELRRAFILHTLLGPPKSLE